MVKTEFYMTRSDGVNLYRTYSDQGRMLIRNDGVEYGEAVDVENSGYTYTEGNYTEGNYPVENMTETEAKALAYDIITGVAE